MKLNKYIVGFMASTLMMLASSCRDDTFSEYRDENNSDEFTVTINVGLEGMEYSTRKGEGKTDDISKKHYIGEGSQVDMLVYAVYFDANKSNGSTTTNSDPDWEAAPEYTKGVVDPENKFEDLKVTPGYGQTILYVGNTLPKNEKQQITLTLKKGQQYKVVFWAQNHKTEAFVIDDLKRVQMKYKVVHSEEGKPEEIKSLNNDEQRDAFCRSVDISGDQSNRDITIYLRRPLAQINVGTTGYDFETITRNADKKYLYSKIRINRAARYLNVVEDYVYTNTIGDDPSITEDKEAFYTIDYEYAKIPAYWDMEIPKYPSYTAYDLNEGGAFDIFKHNHGALLDQSNEKNSFLSIYGQEEFLRVHLNKPKEGSDENSNDNEEDTEEDTEEPPVFRDEYDDGYLPYASMGASGDDDNNVQTEIFKYLSMCYILTPTNGSHTLTNVKMWVATDEEGSDEVEVLNLNNVPVKANHRTNMVGSLLTAKADMQIIVDEDFAGRKIHGNNDLQSGEIVEGFYYDAEKNEFQISSVNGLLFFQQLVNGDLTVRQVYNTGQGVAVGDPYPYYSPDDPDDKTTYSLKYKSWKRSDLKNEDIANIIIKGSGYDQLAVSSGKSEKCANKNWTIKVQYNGSKGNNNLWPEYNNFPFYGATVKLMADIDLAGIEWIPIGFDCANWDNTFGSYNKGYNGYYNSTKDNLIINYIALTNPDKTKTEIDLGRRRAFCGTFDGNGHTIYNLRTKRFGAAVHESAFQEYETSNMGGPYDNVQWFEKGTGNWMGSGQPG